MKLMPFLSQSKSLDSKFNSYFPSCGNIATLSFRDISNNNNTNFYKDDNNFRTFNSAFLDTPDSLFTNISSSSRSFSTMSDDDNSGLDPNIESLIRGVSSNRLFFKPEQSCSLLLQLNPEQEAAVEPPEPESEASASGGWVEYKESEAMCMESNNPCDDFRRSMEEMVEAHGLKEDWQGLEELLGCYLKINDQPNHGYIMAAFFDLLVNLSFISPDNANNNNNNTTTTSSSSILSTNNNLNSSSPSSLTTLSSLFDLDDHCNHDDR